MSHVDFSSRRNSGQCPSCNHYGIDCRCHTRPKAAAKEYVYRLRREIEAKIQQLAEAERQYGLPVTPVIPPHELDATYVRPDDRFLVSLLVSYEPNRDGVRTPKQAVEAALRLITIDGTGDTLWTVFDRETDKRHEIKQPAFDFCGS